MLIWISPEFTLTLINSARSHQHSSYFQLFGFETLACCRLFQVCNWNYACFTYFLFADWGSATKYLQHLVFSWRSIHSWCCVTMPVVGWSGWPSWFSPKWTSFGPCKASCHTWAFWFLLWEPFSFPKYLFFDEGTVKVSLCSNNQVTALRLVQFIDLISELA